MQQSWTQIFGRRQRPLTVEPLPRQYSLDDFEARERIHSKVVNRSKRSIMNKDRMTLEEREYPPGLEPLPFAFAARFKS